MQQGGSQYGVSPEMTPFSGAGGGTHLMGGISASTDHLQQQQKKKSSDAVLAAEAASPISSRPPAVDPSSGNFDELVPVSGGFLDDDALAGEEVERGVTGGNRWPRQETLALLKIRSEMDAAFRDATLKGPLWEDVSRKLAELGYVRSAKKCKEKFENVHKYYKRTKEGRAGRQDGKSYRFFSQLEALHSSSSNTAGMPSTTTSTSTPTTTTNPAAAATASIGIGSSNPMAISSGRIQPPTVSATPAATTNQIGVPRVGLTNLSAGMQTGSATATTTAGISFSSNTSSSSSDSEDDLEEEGGQFNPDSRKRKRGSRGGSGSSRKMMSFFEGLMKQVMEKQEALQQRFLETIEKREQDRMIREEAWKRQEMARLAREHEIMAQERAISASRDAAIIAFLQKITGQTIQLPPPISIPAAPPPQSTTPPPPPPPPPHPPAPPKHQQQRQQQQQEQQQQHRHHHQSQNVEMIGQQPASSEVVVAVPEQQQQQTHLIPQEMGSGGGSFDPASSRWPKAEVLALIKLRSGLESRYQEAGPKGPLWEEISGGMQKMGYKRSAKRCKEKWENINKYFKKVKESNKKRPEDAKTCPYFHQLDALYRKKLLGGSSSGGGSSSFGDQYKQEQQQETMEANPTTNLPERSDLLAIMPPPQPAQISEIENKKTNSSGGNTEVQSSNEALPPSLFEEGNSGPRGAAEASVGKKPEDIVKELMVQQQQLQQIMDDYDSDNLDQEDDEDGDEDDDGDGDEEAEEERKMGYKIQFQRQNASGSSNGGGNASVSFLAIVQ